VVTGGVVDYDAVNGTYALPRHRAAVLTRAAGPENLADAGFSDVAVSEIESDPLNYYYIARK
jgi:hypothetical protein